LCRASANENLHARKRSARAVGRRSRRRHVGSKCDRDGDHLGSERSNLLNQFVDGNVGAEEPLVPSVEREQIGDHAGTEIVSLILRARNDDARSAGWPSESRIERGDGRLCRRRGEVFVRDADPVRLPEPADLVKGCVDDLFVQVAHAAAFEDLLREPFRAAAIALEYELEERAVLVGHGSCPPLVAGVSVRYGVTLSNAHRGATGPKQFPSQPSRLYGRSAQRRRAAPLLRNQAMG
jgi:hypothetical protein